MRWMRTHSRCTLASSWRNCSTTCMAMDRQENDSTEMENKQIMQIELYDKVEKPLTLEPAQEAEFAQFETELTLEDLEARIGYCVTLGLRAQAKTLQEYHTLYTLKKSIPYPWLSKEGEETLRRIYP